MDYSGHIQYDYGGLIMKSAAVSTLKATLSACLAKVKAGEEVIVMERGKPIAKLVPLPRHGEIGSAHLQDLARSGLARLGTGKLPTGFWKMRRPQDRRGQAVKALLSERAEGR
jgi:prevent-host-death family protein